MDVHDRINHFVKKVESSNAEGVIFTRLKFCDPEGFDHPDIKKALDAKGIPSLLIESELSATDVGAVTTRIEAFAEQLEQR
jgi:benzoyl-CoA reductase/2-hydroxyglutaryl-CoA dehydratase subunit BcrC/BadD/HgdB